MLKVGLDTFTIRELELSPFGQLDYARSHGFEGVQFDDIYQLSPTLDVGQFREVHRYADESGSIRTSRSPAAIRTSTRSRRILCVTGYLPRSTRRPRPAGTSCAARSAGSTNVTIIRSTGSGSWRTPSSFSWPCARSSRIMAAGSTWRRMVIAPPMSWSA